MLGWFAETTLVASGLAVVAVLAGRLRSIGPTARHVLWLVVLIKMMTPPLVSWPWAVPWRDLELADHFTRGGLRLGRVARASICPRSRRPSDRTVAARTATSCRTSPARSHRLRPRLWFQPLRFLPRSCTFRCPMRRRSSAGWCRVAGHLGHPGDRAGRPDHPVPPPAARGRAGPGRPGRGGRADRPAAGRARARAAGGPRPGHAVALVPGPAPAPAPGPTGQDPAFDRWRGILTHELAHLRRGDHWVSRLELAAGLIWWWNPLYWLTRARLDAEAELACDAWVVWALPKDRLAYAEVLFDICATLSLARSPAPALGVAGSGRFFERRLTMILHDHVPCRLSPLGLLGACLLVLFALPSWSAANPAAVNTEDELTAVTIASDGRSRLRRLRHGRRR